VRGVTARSGMARVPSPVVHLGVTRLFCDSSRFLLLSLSWSADDTLSIRLSVTDVVFVNLYRTTCWLARDKGHNSERTSLLCKRLLRGRYRAGHDSLVI
jgi:hypothetical protein